MEPMQVTLFTVKHGRRELFGTAEVNAEDLPAVIIYGSRAFVRAKGSEYEEEPAAAVHKVHPE